MSEHRTHLVTLLQMIWRFLFLLIFPAARGFLTALSGGNVAEWLDGAWKDILIIAAILLLALHTLTPRNPLARLSALWWVGLLCSTICSRSVPAENVHSRR